MSVCPWRDGLRAVQFATFIPIRGLGDTRQASRPKALAGFVRLVVLLLVASFSRAAEVIPPAPPRHFNDFAQVVRTSTATQLDRELDQFERDTSNQILVAIYPRLQSSSSVEDYAVRVAQSWRVGQKARDNGAVLFVFQESHDIRIVTGYGLEGALPDILCKQIIENEIVPRFRAGDFDGGLTSGVHAMMAATRGEYRGTGRTVGQVSVNRGIGTGTIVFIIVLFVIFRAMSRRGVVYSPLGRRNIWINNGPWGGGGGGWSGGSGGGGGGFSGGGGSFGGGGAGGKW